MKILLFLLAGTMISVRAVSQKSLIARLDSFSQSLYRYGQINGNILVAEKGKVVYQHSFGYANFSLKQLNGRRSRFTLGSVAKIFTSSAILQLKDKSKLRLEEPFVKYFPDFPYPQVTIRHLLSHTSGLPDYELYAELLEKNPEKIFSNTDIIPALKAWQRPLYFPPGEKWQYSNTNFSLLALLVERLSGMMLREYLQEFIFRPAKMTNTYFLTDSTQVADQHRTTNYQYPALYASELSNVDSIGKLRWRLYNLSGFVGQGNIISSTQDLLNFDQALYTHQLIQASTLEEAFTPTKLNGGQEANADIGIGKASHGLGWFIFGDKSAGEVVWHTGGVPGGLTIFLRNVSRQQAIIVMDNAFSEGLFQHGNNLLNILNAKTITMGKKTLAQDYGSRLVKKGVDAAFCRLLELRADSSHYSLTEEPMNRLGYQLLYEASFEGHHQLALEVFKLNTLLFPTSYNVYDSYGEGLLESGNKTEAILMYKKSLELNPGNQEGKEALKRILGN